MRQPRLRRRAVALAAVGALLAAGCGSDTVAPDDAASPFGTASPADDATAAGVTKDACPDAVNADNGCIYLGTLSDLTEGPFASLGIEIVAGQEAFWNRVNRAGGIGGYDINVTEYVRDNKYDAAEHLAQLTQIEPSILALAQSLGTSTTRAALDLLREKDVVAAPGSWWSGWAFEDVVVDSGYSYCVEAMNGLDYADGDWLDNGVTSIVVVRYADEYGADAAAGVTIWAAANEVDFVAATDVLEAAPYSASGNQDDLVEAILDADPSIVYLATGPLEAAEIIGKTVADGFDGRFVGSVTTFNPALLANAELAEVLPARYRQVGPWGPFGSDTAAHRAMAEALGEQLPTNDGFTYGWVWQYPLKAAIEEAVAQGDLTRAGLRAAVATMTVNYEGALPDRTYRGGATVPKQAIIAAPDTDAPLGLKVVKEAFTGDTAANFTPTGPC